MPVGSGILEKRDVKMFPKKCNFAYMEKAPLETLLLRYIPETAVESVAAFLRKHRVKLVVSPGRRSILGNYRPPVAGKVHRISVNGDLNPYAFLITLTHEMAHLEVWERYGNRVLPHGGEWKAIYAGWLAGWLEKDLFPPDLAVAVVEHVTAPGASTCADPDLYRALRKYDAIPKTLLDELEDGQWFVTRNGDMMQRGKKRRTRYECLDYSSGRRYLVPAIMEVEPVPSPETGPVQEPVQVHSTSEALKNQGWCEIDSLKEGDRCLGQGGNWLEICKKSSGRIICGNLLTGEVYKIVKHFLVKPESQIPVGEKPSLPKSPVFLNIKKMPDGAVFRLNGQLFEKKAYQEKQILARNLTDGKTYRIPGEAWVRVVHD